MPISIDAANPREPWARVAVIATIGSLGAAYFALWRRRVGMGTLVASRLKMDPSQ